MILIEVQPPKKEKKKLTTYLCPSIHQNSVLCVLKVSKTSSISLTLFLSEPLLGGPLFREDRGHMRSKLRVGTCVY